MRRTFLLLASVAIAALSASGIALALPSEDPDDTPMVDGRVRAFAKVGTHVWVGGSFSRVQRRDGTVLGSVTNVAVFDSATGRYLDIAPKLGGEGSTVYDMARYGYFVTATEGDEGESDFVHTEKFVLVDPDKRIRGYYDGTDSIKVDELMKDLDILLAEYAYRKED